MVIFRARQPPPPRFSEFFIKAHHIGVREWFRLGIEGRSRWWWCRVLALPSAPLIGHILFLTRTDFEERKV